MNRLCALGLATFVISAATTPALAYATMRTGVPVTMENSIARCRLLMILRHTPRIDERAYVTQFGNCLKQQFDRLLDEVIDDGLLPPEAYAPASLPEAEVACEEWVTHHPPAVKDRCINAETAPAGPLSKDVIASWKIYLGF